MQQFDYITALSEVAGLLRQFGERSGIPLLCCDAAAYDVQWIKDPSRLNLKGGGGTDMAVGISAAVDLGYKVVIVCTDGITPYGPPPPSGVKVTLCLTQPPTSSYPVPDWADSYVVCESSD